MLIQSHKKKNNLDALHLNNTIMMSNSRIFRVSSRLNSFLNNFRIILWLLSNRINVYSENRRIHRKNKMSSISFSLKTNTFLGRGRRQFLILILNSE
jgi:hypothetical protein